LDSLDERHRGTPQVCLPRTKDHPTAPVADTPGPPADVPEARPWVTPGQNMPLPQVAAPASMMTARTVSMAPRAAAPTAGTERDPAQLRPMASHPQTIATGPRTIPSTKNPATAQTSPMIPSVARSGPDCDPIRPRVRGCLRVPCPKLAIINSLKGSLT